MAEYVLADSGGTPSRMNREGAARTYSLYQSWGYFQRRMLLRRAAAADNQDQRDMRGAESTEWGNTEKPQSSYGETSAVWRWAAAQYFGIETVLGLGTQYIYILSADILRIFMVIITHLPRHRHGV